jgi:hypothetical protein
MHLCLLLTLFARIQTSTIIEMENCTFAIELYRKYFNLLWSSDDARTLRLQAIYSLTSNQSLLPGQIYSHLSQSVASIPFIVRCTSSTSDLLSTSFLPFTQCSSTVNNLLAKKNYESTRTYLNLQSVLSMLDMPVLYIGQSNLLLSNCSFQYNSFTYRLKSTEIFTLQIEYESSLRSSCHSCNQRTSLCQDGTCQCRSGTIPLKLHRNEQYCIDVTRNCSWDSQRCLHTKSLTISPVNTYVMIVFAILMSFICCLASIVLVLLWYSSRSACRSKQQFDSNQSIYSIDKHERTPSTISTIDSLKYHELHSLNFLDEYIRQYHDDNDYNHHHHRYPKIIGDENNADIVLILV